MPRRPPPEAAELAAQRNAHMLIAAESLPRLLRLAERPDTEARLVLAAIQRRIVDRGKAANGRLLGEMTATQGVVSRVLEAAVQHEMRRRAPDLGTDGTP